MLTLVLGGAASGKSEYAEQLVCKSKGVKLYIATMVPYDEECHVRIARHRVARADKGFATLECPMGLAAVKTDADADTVLLECMSNLVANELFMPDGARNETQSEIMRGIDHLCAQAANVVVVSNSVFSDGIEYDAGTMEYLTILSAVNCAMAARADRVVEVVCTIPLWLK